MGNYEIYSIYTDLVILKTKKMMYNFVSFICNFIRFFISLMLYLYAHTHIHTSISIFIIYNVQGLFIKTIQVEYLFMHTHTHAKLCKFINEKLRKGGEEMIMIPK